MNSTPAFSKGIYMACNTLALADGKTPSTAYMHRIVDIAISVC